MNVAGRASALESDGLTALFSGNHESAPPMTVRGPFAETMVRRPKRDGGGLMADRAGAIACDAGGEQAPFSARGVGSIGSPTRWQESHAGLHVEIA
jgi:hypothetical protein